MFASAPALMNGASKNSQNLGAEIGVKPWREQRPEKAVAPVGATFKAFSEAVMAAGMASTFTLHILGKVMFLPEVVNKTQLRFKPIGVLFLANENILKHIPRSVIVQ